MADVVAPMPGTIKEIIVKVGDAVKEDEELIILEAMKMENPIVAPSNGTVKECSVLLRKVLPPARHAAACKCGWRESRQ